ncbi:MAG: hypothetical protein WCI18_11795 [Pseudomonadota bacterium]
MDHLLSESIIIVTASLTEASGKLFASLRIWQKPAKILADMVLNLA